MAKNEPTADDGTVELDFDNYEETEVELPSKTETKKKVEVEEEKPETVVEEKVEVEAKAEPEPVEDDEQTEVSKGAQKRINQLTKKMREAERQREEAINYAQAQKAEADKLKSRVNTLDHGYLNEYGGRIKAEQTQAQEDLKKAMMANDPDGVVAAQTKISQLAVSANEYAKAQQQQEMRTQQAQQAAQQPQQPVQQQPQAAPRQQAPDPKAEEWASRNEWFGKDEAMTFATFGLHKKMVEEEGFDPLSDEYYDELDNRLVRTFPNKLGTPDNGSGRKPVQTVASGSRSKTSGRKNSNKVRLTQSQVAIANRLGVPVEEYAKYVKQ